MSATEIGHDYIFEIAQEIRENRLKEWDEKRKESYWRETARRCEEIGIEKEFIRLVSSAEFKREVGNSHVFTHGLRIPFQDVDQHYGTMRAGAAHIIRKRNSAIFKEVSAKIETV